VNERIKELSIKAGFPEWSNHAIEFELEQFAELIVRECADIATINAHQWASPGTYVLKHFGVEE